MERRGKKRNRMPRAERRQEILLALCRRKKDTRMNLAFEFGVTKRTIEIDIMNLSLRYPIYTKQGGGGGIFIDEDFVPDMKFFTDRQTSLAERLLGQLEGEDRTVMESILKTFVSPKRRKRS